MPFPDYTPTIPEFIRTRVEAFGERPLIVLNDERITYREADERSQALARGLLATGVAKGTRVGLLAPNGPDWVVGFLAAARIGAVVVPMNTFYKPRELGWVMRHADVNSLLTVSLTLAINSGWDSKSRLYSFGLKLALRTLWAVSRALKVSPSVSS